ncbi:hypothetical protein UM538_12590 [Staphylococcus aureus]|nr:hypothetical protein UM538_12590 [Staphylococcus aureus]
MTAANAAKTALDQARDGLTVDKSPLEMRKINYDKVLIRKLVQTGMTQDSCKCSIMRS